MKKILNFVVALVALSTIAACSKEQPTVEIYLDVTPNNIAGVWSLQSYDNGVELQEGSYLYMDFVRADRTFVCYDNLNSMETRITTGNYAIEVNEAAIIRGNFDNGVGDWANRYYVRNLTKDSMVWVATDDASDVRVYVRAELPEWIDKVEKED